jgi:hypothetical protein
MYFHVILFEFAQEVSPEQANEVLRDLGELRAHIPQIHAYHFGCNDPDNKDNRNLTHVFVMQFRSQADRHLYQNHPLHQRFIKTRLEPILADGVVLDFIDRDGLQ